MTEDKIFIDFLLEAKKKAEESDPYIKKLTGLDLPVYPPIYGYVITLSSN